MEGGPVNYLLLDATTRFGTTQGQALFGEHFHFVISMVFPLRKQASGGLDVVLPLASLALLGPAPSEAGAFFLQHGMTRWVDDQGLGRNDFRFGAVRRFDLSDEAAAQATAASISSTTASCRSMRTA